MSLNLQKVVFVKTFYQAPFKYTFNYKEIKEAIGFYLLEYQNLKNISNLIVL
jgi:hypothetical protein